MKMRAEMSRKRTPILPPEHTVDKVVEIPETAFATFLIQPLDHYGFIEQNAVTPFQDDGTAHCLLVLGEGRTDGVLVQCNSFGEASLMSYLAGARDTVNAELNRAVDFVVQQGTEYTDNGYWCVFYEELADRTGLTVSEGSGLDDMLKEALKRRPEVASVGMKDGVIETDFHSEFCHKLQHRVATEQQDVRLRDILPLLTASDLAPDDPCQSFVTHPEADACVWPEDLNELTPSGREDHAALLNARVTEITPTGEGTKVVLTDVDPEELARFNEAYDHFQNAEQAMGDMTP